MAELQRDTKWIASIPLSHIDDLDTLDVDSAESDPIPFRGTYAFQASLPTSAEQQISDSKLQPLLTQYDSVFQEPSELPPSRPDDHRITLTPDAKLPPWRPLGHLSEYELLTLKEHLKKLMDKGFIQHSASPYGANIIFAKKNDGSLRLCIDYRRLNSITVKDRTPLPNIKEMQERLSSAKFFTKLDLRDGFHNIMLHPDDQHKTAFRTRYGHFEFKVLPFGLCNAPATFTRMMNRIFGDLYDTCIIAYVDDILIYSKTEEDHLRHLDLVFQRLQENKLFLKLSKCAFGKSSVDFCGTTVSSQGVHIDNSKLEALFATPAPTNVKQLQSFLGICNWFRDFIPDFSIIAHCLTELTKKSTPWDWNYNHQTAILILLHKIANAPCLTYFNPELETHVYTDASLYGIGGWIGQTHADEKIHPIAFWSRKLLPAEVNYPTHERELLAIVEMTKRFRHFLLGRTCFVHTDHKALEFLQTQPNLSVRQVNWVDHLQQFDLIIAYLAGPLNHLADYLSRRPDFSPKCPKCSTNMPIVISSIEKLKNDRNLNNPPQSGNATAQIQSGNATNNKKQTVCR